MGLWSTGFLERMEEAGLYKKPEMVEVVRCKDCVNRHDPINCKMYSEGMDTPDDWFCADGERR